MLMPFCDSMRYTDLSVTVHRKDAKGQHTETGVLCSPHRRHLIVQICTVKVKHRLSTPLQRARDWSVLPREGGWRRSMEAGDRSRLTKMLWERSREPGVELTTRGEAASTWTRLRTRLEDNQWYTRNWSHEGLKPQRPRHMRECWATLKTLKPRWSKLTY